MATSAFAKRGDELYIITRKEKNGTVSTLNVSEIHEMLNRGSALGWWLPKTPLEIELEKHLPTPRRTQFTVDRFMQGHFDPLHK